MSGLTPDIAERFARIALGHVGREYPHKLDHVLSADADARTPRDLHPIFFGSFDWHSCVHGWWMLLTLRRLHPDIAAADEIDVLAAASFTPANIAAECAYLDRPGAAGFERPYGWAWLLYLHLEATRRDNRELGDRLAPLAHAFAARFDHYLDILTYPIRTGTHFNSAFAIVLAHDWATRFDPALAAKMTAAVRRWFGDDRDCQAWEPGGDEFLSPALIEALAVERTQSPEFARRWLADFLPRIATRQPQGLLTPAHVSDRGDGKIAHLDGVNLSRAWCWQSLLPLMGPREGDVVRGAVARHLTAGLDHVAGDYMGEHWLSSFATLALLAIDQADARSNSGA